MTLEKRGQVFAVVSENEKLSLKVRMKAPAMHEP